VSVFSHATLKLCFDSVVLQNTRGGVYLFWSLQETGSFYGYGKMTSTVRMEDVILPIGSATSVFNVEWLNTAVITCQVCMGMSKSSWFSDFFSVDTARFEPFFYISHRKSMTSEIV